MHEVVVEIAVLFVLFAANGLFAMSEIAVVSAKRARLRGLSERGSISARAALALAESPNRFLSTVQIGITLVGIFAGAFGGARLAGKLAAALAPVPWLAPYASQVAMAAVVGAITYFSLVLGELVPKRLGLSAPERIAMAVARPMGWLATIARPLVSFLSASTDLLLRIVGFKPARDTSVTEDEVRVMMQEGVRAGAFNSVESRIVHGALELDSLRVREIMTPRPKVIWLNLDDSHEQIWHKVVAGNHSHFPVYEGNRDHTIGMVSVKSMYANLAAGVPVRLRDLLAPPLVVPATQTVLQLVESFKSARQHIALVADEFGALVGLVTLNDVMEALVGEIPSQDERVKPEARHRDDGTWLIDAMVGLDTVEQALPNFRFSVEIRDEFQTLAGYVVHALGHVPAEGEIFDAQGYRFEVIDMDGHRVDKVLVSPLRTAAPPPGPAGPCA